MKRRTHQAALSLSTTRKKRASLTKSRLLHLSIITRIANRSSNLRLVCEVDNSRRNDESNSSCVTPADTPIKYLRGVHTKYVHIHTYTNAGHFRPTQRSTIPIMRQKQNTSWRKTIERTTRTPTSYLKSWPQIFPAVDVLLQGRQKRLVVSISSVLRLSLGRAQGSTRRNETAKSPRRNGQHVVRQK